MTPIVAPAEMESIDAEASEPVDVLIERAGWAVANLAARMLEDGGGVYGSRVAVLVGPGNNGADGRSAARILARRGVACEVFDISASEPTGRRPGGEQYDLIIDACYGTGLKREFRVTDLPVQPDGTPVLAVDIPSGVDGLTGQVIGQCLPATATVTFAALKPGLLLEPGRSLAGAVEVADIGLDCSRATSWLLEASDIGRWPRRHTDAYKWRHAVAVVGASPGMAGAAALCASAAFRAGAGYVIKAQPGPLSDQPGIPIEAVSVSMVDDWNRTVEQAKRCNAAVIGPGLDLGLTNSETREMVRGLCQFFEAAVVVDAGALEPGFLADILPLLAESDDRPPILTPHDGEYERLLGKRPGADRVEACRQAALEFDAVVVLKGPTTVVSEPSGRTFISTAGDQRLATAGTGDVLSGVVGAGLALGLDSFLAAALAVELHGRAAKAGLSRGLLAGEIPRLVAERLDQG